MNKIATLQELIKVFQRIKEKVIVEQIPFEENGYTGVNYICRLPEPFHDTYYGWARDVQRFIYQLGEMSTLQKVRQLMFDFEHVLFISQGSPTNEGRVTTAFKSILLELNKLKISCNLSNKVFVVHGHSEDLNYQTEAFLRKLGLDPIFLRDQVNQGQTIIEKLETNTDVAFAIVLYTGCDRGGLNETGAPLMPRARQNVIFEHGFLNAILGRNRVCALVEEGVEVPSDLSGIVYIPIDTNGSWRYSVAKEMRFAGLDIDLNQVN